MTNSISKDFLSSKTLFKFLIFLNLVALNTLSSCVTPHEPIERFEDKEKDRKEKIESTLSQEYGGTAYQSLGYGPLIVYKPKSFKELDSLYALKEDFLERNDLRGLESSEVEDKIPAYRAEAQEDIDKVQYEIEHIYSVEREEYITVYHDVFFHDHEDSLISRDHLYDYTFPKQYEKMHINYLFEYHFITKRDLYISSNELQFIRHFKEIERSLIGSDELSPFMINLMETMTLAQNINSVDFKELIKYKSIQDLKLLGGNITINEFGILIAMEEDERIVGYEYEIRWEDNADKVKKKTIFTYSPTLSLKRTETTKE